MKKNIYSLVLSEDVVNEVDRLAYMMNKNRSGMINQILAEYVSYVTPEKRMSDTFKRMEDIINDIDSLKLVLGASDSIMSIKSAIAYKYNPSLRYSVELLLKDGRHVGQLRVSLRTQNKSLIFYLLEFYNLWRSIEETYIGECSYCIYDDGKMSREMELRYETDAEVSSSRLGDAIVGYINAFDTAIKMFFSNPDDVKKVKSEINNIYLKYLKECDFII